MFDSGDLDFDFAALFFLLFCLNLVFSLQIKVTNIQAITHNEYSTDCKKILLVVKVDDL